MFRNSAKFENLEERPSAKRLDFESLSDSSFDKTLILPAKTTESSNSSKVQEARNFHSVQEQILGSQPGLRVEYCPQLEFNRGLSRIWENDDESDCRYSENDREDDKAYG